MPTYTHYFITIRKHRVKEYVSPDAIEDSMAKLRTKLPYLEKVMDCYEIDTKYKQLHYHAWVKSPKKITFRGNTSDGTFRIYWKLMYSILPVIKYMQKQDSCSVERSQIFDENYYNHHYGFDMDEGGGGTPPPD